MVIHVTAIYKWLDNLAKKSANKQTTHEPHHYTVHHLPYENLDILVIIAV
jgi:hypothetical protein